MTDADEIKRLTPLLETLGEVCFSYFWKIWFYFILF